MREERYRPLAFLSDFNIVDTPGTNSVPRIDGAAIGGLFPEADLVFFILPVGNPWEAATRNLLVVTIASTSIFRWKWMRSEGGRRQILCDSLEWMGMRPKGWPLALKLADMPAWHRQLLLNLSSSSLLRSYNRGFKSFDRFSIFVRFCCSGEANDLSRDRMNHILVLLEYFFQEATEGFFLLRKPKSALSW